MRQLFGAGVLAVVAFVWLAPAGRAAAADFPTGTFTTKIMGMDLDLAFDGKGKFTVSVKDKVEVEGSYKATKDQIEFQDEKGPMADKSAGPGTYKWKLDGKKLTFTKVKDKNPGRAGALTEGAWTKK